MAPVFDPFTNIFFSGGSKRYVRGCDVYLGTATLAEDLDANFHKGLFCGLVLIPARNLLMVTHTSKASNCFFLKNDDSGELQFLAEGAIEDLTEEKAIILDPGFVDNLGRELIGLTNPSAFLTPEEMENKFHKFIVSPN